MLIKDIAPIHKHIPTTVGMDDFEMFRTYTEDAERWLKREVLGVELYNRIDGDPTDATNAPLVDFFQKLAALKGGYVGIPALDLIMTNNGFAVANNQNISPASKDRVNRFIESLQKRFYDELEELYIFLEENDQFHTEWKNSDAYVFAFDHIVVSAVEFNEYVFIDQSRLVYSKLHPSISNVEKLELPKYLSKEFIDEIISQQKEDTLTAANLLILDSLKAASANLSMARGINPLSVIIDEKGISRSYVIGQKSVANEDRMKLLKEHFTSLGMEYVGQVVKVLDANPDNYPTYRDSAVYQAKLVEFAGYQNTEESSIFVGPC